jgi:Kef-type K+ transport system membrane component KefB
MSAPPSTPESALTRREELAVSGAALSDAPWKLAGAAGIVVAGADLALHLLTLHLAWAAALSMGAVAFFAVAGAGALIRSRRSRALRWARSQPWRFALIPGAAAAVVVFVLTVLHGSGVLGSAYTSLWHGAIAFVLTGAAGTLVRPRRKQRT